MKQKIPRQRPNQKARMRANIRRDRIADGKFYPEPRGKAAQKGRDALAERIRLEQEAQAVTTFAGRRMEMPEALRIFKDVPSYQKLAKVS